MSNLKIIFLFALLICTIQNPVCLRGNTRRPPLHDAIIHGDFKEIRTEIAKASDINEKINHPKSCFNNMTALQIAVIMNMVNVADLLLKKGARKFINVKIQNRYSLFDGWSPLHIAAYNQSEKMCTLLVSYGADTSSIISGQFCHEKLPLDLYKLN